MMFNETIIAYRSYLTGSNVKGLRYDDTFRKKKKRQKFSFLKCVQ